MDKDIIQTILEQYSIIKRHGQRQHTNYTGTVFYNKEAWTKTAYKLSLSMPLYYRILFQYSLYAVFVHASLL